MSGVSEVSSAGVPRLQDARVLAVVPHPGRALGIGAALASAGAQVDVARTLTAALVVLERPRAVFDVAIVDFDLGDDLSRFVVAMRERPEPCFHVAVGDAARIGDMRSALACSAVEILTTPFRATALVAATMRALDATMALRAQCAVSPSRSTASLARSGAGRRAQLGIEGAAQRMADRLGLSSRQQLVLRYLALGYRYQEIGEELGISTRTVKFHVDTLRKKLGAGSRAELLGRLFAA